MQEPVKRREIRKIEFRAIAPESEYSVQFIQGMLNRIAVSNIKYGAIAINFPDRVDAMACVDQRIAQYVKTGNSEFLIDAANFLMFEFMIPKHETAFFRATDADESPGIVMGDGSVTSRGENA